jgi:hypothetical protein
MNQFLREELGEIIREAMPAPVIELTPTGEMLSHEAMEVARFYHRANRDQRRALDAVVKAIGVQP